jgi:rhomboid family GlyGly-CTERM serine protease
LGAATQVRGLPIPVWTLAICAAAAVVFGMPQLQAALVYNREAIAAGEIWRLVSGSLVHFSGSHFVKDVVALLAIGLLIESGRRGHFALLCLASGSLIGPALYVAEPELAVYGGLSGIVTAAATYLCLHGIEEDGAYRWLCLGVLSFLAVKTGCEIALGFSPLPGAGAEEFALVPRSHAVGAATAIALFALENRRNHPRTAGAP